MSFRAKYGIMAEFSCTNKGRYDEIFSARAAHGRTISASGYHDGFQAQYRLTPPRSIAQYSTTDSKTSVNMETIQYMYSRRQTVNRHIMSVTIIFRAGIDGFK